MKRTTRILLIIGAVILLLFGALWWYLSSSLVASQVAGQLAKVYGAPVEVGGASVGIVGHSKLNDLKLHEAGGESAPVWLTVGHLDTDLSAWDVLRGDTLPKEVTVADAVVRLRYDRKGHLITRIPRPTGKTRGFPNVHLENSRVILEREGHPQQLDIGGIKGDLTNEGDQLVLRGTVADKSWGDWKVGGGFRKNDYATRVSLTTLRPVHITLDMLREIPFVAESVWKTVQLDGDTPGTLVFGYDPAKKAATYRMDLAPVNTRVDVPVIKLATAHTSGKVVIEDEIIKLRDVHGDGYGGKIHVEADLDFSGPASKLHFYQVEGQNLQVAQLPEKFPARIKHLLTSSATLSGHGDLLVTLAGGKVKTEAKGEVVVSNTRLGGPLTIDLQSGPDGLQLGQPAGSQPTSQGATRGPAGKNDGPRRYVAYKPKSAAFRTNFLPARLVNQFHAGLLGLTETLLVGGAPAAGPPQKAPAPAPAAAPAPKAPQYWEANLSMQDVDIAQFIKGIGLKLPVAVTGRFSFRLQVGIPLSSTKDLKAYRATGTITAPELAVEDFHLRNVRAHVVLQNGVLRLDELKAVVPPESGGAPEQGEREQSLISGTAGLQVAPLGDLTANVSLTNIPLQQAAGLVPGLEEKPTGTVSATLQARVPVRQMNSPAAWEGSGTITSPEVQAFGWAFKDVDAQWRVHEGRLTLTKARAAVAGTKVSASGDLKLANPYGFKARIHLPSLDLAALKQLSPRFRLPVALAGTLKTSVQVTGTLAPFGLIAGGDALVSDLKVEGVALQSLQFHWQATADRLAVSDLTSGLYGGKMSGTAVIPFKTNVPGQVDLSFQKLDVAALARAIPRNPVRLAGTANGSIKATLPAAKQGKERTARVELNLKAPQLRIQGIPAERVQGTVDYAGGTLDYRLKGFSLGGTFNFQGKIPTGASDNGGPQRQGRLYPTAHGKTTALAQAAAPAEGGGKLQVRGIELGQLWEAYNIHNTIGALTGTLDLDLTYRLEGPERTPVGSGVLLLRNLRWGQVSLGGAVRSDVTLSKNELRFGNLSGTLGAGTISGQLAVNLKNLDRSWVYLRFTGVEASRLFSPWPGLARNVEGTMEVVLRSTLGHEWTGGGRVWLPRGRVAGIEIDDWTLPLEWIIAPGSGRWEINVRGTSATVALGRVSGDVRMTWIQGVQLEGGRLTFQGVDIRTLLHELSTGSQYGSGKLSGRFDFGSNNFQSLNDLTGTLDATLAQVQPANFPVLRQMIPFMGSGGSSATTFSSGVLRGTLNAGVFRIEKFNVSSSMLQVLIRGNLTTAGRLDLDAIALPGFLASNSTARRLLNTIPLVGQTSSRLVGIAGRALASQLIHLRVTGTLRNPSVRYQPRL